MIKSFFLVAFGLTIATATQAEPLKVGDRVFSDRTVESFAPAARLSHSPWGNWPEVIGTGTIAKILPDGTLIVESDARSDARTQIPKMSITFDPHERAQLRPKVSCPDLQKGTLYSPINYDHWTGKGFAKAEVGVFEANEFFGDCQTGIATIKNPNPDLLANFSGRTPAGSVPVASILKPVNCSYLSIRAFSTEPTSVKINGRVVDAPIGSGVVKQAFGHCSTGVVLFRSDRDLDRDVVVPASSVQLAELNSVQIRPSAATARRVAH